MSISADTLRRLAALHLPADALSEVLSIIADMQSADDTRKAKDRERKRAVRGQSKENPRTVQGNDADIPADPSPPPFPLSSPPTPPPIIPQSSTPSIVHCGREADFRSQISAVYAKHGHLPPETGSAVVWLKQGRDPEICCAVIEDVLQRKGKKLPLSYFEGPIADAHASPRPGNPARPPPPRGKAENGWAALFRKSNGLGEFAHDGHNDDEQHWQAPGRAAIAGR
jgi:hypothetical protein